MREDAEDRTKWRVMSMGSKRLTPTIVGKIASKRLLLLLLIDTILEINLLFRIGWGHEV